MIWRISTRECGSSPLTRGKLRRRVQFVASAGLIPAHAGKTSRRRSAPVASRAHPRSRGENRPRRLPRPCRSGSSPLTRGKPRRRYRPSEHRGLIPAHAGKTGRTRQWPFPSTAHPRSRGENAPDELEADFVRGSSPLTRGKPLSPRSSSKSWGLIPAHAGKTQARARLNQLRKAHPRSRGENHVGHERRWPGRGSSPLTRGKRGCQSWLGIFHGLIPAHAGKTRRPRDRVSRYAAHPRSRGENEIQPHLSEIDGGSSPLTRGKRRRIHAIPESIRLIPAHAGKTFSR